ncbi:MAG: hypothetical protein K2X87_29805 [Gemmataceae bacterium]|nr:hypothetical protein [Gemmataceae bacterium]
MLRVPDLLLATVAQLAPVAQFDCSVLPAAGTYPFECYEFRLVLTFASGTTTEGDGPYTLAAGTTPLDAAEFLHAALSGGKWVSRQVGLSVFVYGYDGSPVTKAVADGDGPKPEVRWWPAIRRKK